MHFKQFYLGCLAQASYLIGSKGEAAVVDPRRDVDEYLDEAARHDLHIKYVVETHLHADFVSGHLELAQRTGAQVVFGARAGAAFPHVAVKDGDELQVGSVVLRFLETPGHTPEGVSVLVIDTEKSKAPQAVLTGDTLFIGDVGRPDLSGSRGFTARDMAGLLYDSLRGKLLTLPDDVLVYPAHGAGSLCGRNMSQETVSTIGEQRRTNYALQEMPRERFVEMVTADLPEVPQYFPSSVEQNRTGAAAIAGRPLPPALSPDAVRKAQAEGGLVLDVRETAPFGAAHIPGSLNVGLGGQFASWCGSLVDLGAPLVIVADDEAGVTEAVTRLSRVGLDNISGYLQGGIAAWDRVGQPLARTPHIPVDELRAQIREARPGLQVLDVRRPAEYATGHVPGARLVPLDKLEKQLATLGLDRARPTPVICAGGYRSSAAASLLERHGFGDLYNVVGGTSAWIAAGYEVEGG